MLNRQKYPLFEQNASGDHDGNFLTGLLFDTVINFELPIEVQGEIIDNHLEDSPDLSGQVATIRDFIAGGARPEVVLARLAVRKFEAAHLAANMIRRQAGLPTRSLRALVLASLEHRKLSPALCRSETVYLKRAGFLDEKRGGLTDNGRNRFAEDETVLLAEEGQRNFRRSKPRALVKNAWMKFCPI